MYIANVASGCTHAEAFFVSLDDLDDISNSLDEDNDLEVYIANLHNVVNTLIFKFEKKIQPIRL